jgi:hypothetical protein
MAKTHRTIESLPAQQNSCQSRLDWNVPAAKPRTPRAEWQFMRKYSLICGTQPSAPQDNGVFTGVN